MLVKLSSTLRRYYSGYDPDKGIQVNLDPAQKFTALDLALQLGLNLPEIKFVMINGRYQPLQTTLQENDRIAFFPAVGGG